MRIKMSWIASSSAPNPPTIRHMEFCSPNARAFHKKYKGRKEVTLDDMLNFCDFTSQKDWVMFQVVGCISFKQLKKYEKTLRNHISSCDYYFTEAALNTRIRKNK